MATVTIGMTEYTVPELNFTGLERAWPFIEECMRTLDPMKGPSAGLRVIASGLMEAEDFKQTNFGMDETYFSEEKVFDNITAYLKKKLKAKEIGQVVLAVNDIMREAGVMPEEGELKPPVGEVEVIPSMETAPDTSQNSLQPDVRVEAGTA